MSGASRVSIPESLRRTIDDIKEIAGEHGDEDVLAMLKECSMDPNETAQKLLFLDTFHEVKRKRDRRKVCVNTRVYEEYQRTPGMQRRGTTEAIGGRRINACRENGYSSTMAKDSKSSVPNLHKESNAVPAVASSKASGNGSTSLSNGSSSHKLASQLAECYIGGVIKDTKADHGNKLRNLPSVRTFVVKRLLTVDPGPTPTPTPTNISTVATGAKNQGGNLNLKSSHLGNSVNSPSVSGLYSSASDPVLVPSLSPQNPGTVGIIKRETGNLRNTAEISADSKMNAVQNVPIGQEVSGSVDLTSNLQLVEFQGSEKSQLTDSSPLSSSTSHHVAAAKGNQESCQLNGPSKEILPEASIAPEEATLKSLPTQDNPSSKSEARKSVIFPNHLHVPEAFKNALTFGSLDATLGQNNGDSNSTDASLPNFESTKESSLIDKPSFPTSGRGDYHVRPSSPPHVLINSSPSQENISSDMALRYDQSTQDAMHSVGGPHTSLLPLMPDQSLSFIPPVVGPHLAHPEGLDPQGGNSRTPSTACSAPSLTQSRGIAQSSIPLSPQLFPFVRQPYPPNYIPYNPYISHVYMPPQNPHQFLSHSGFLQQSSPGNIYMPPTAASGVKYPIPPVYKPGSIPPNLTGISSAYGSYGPLQPGTSASNDDIAASELNEKNMYSTVKQNEDLHAFNSTPGRDISTLQANLYYNFSPAQVGHNSYPGIYHPNQSMSLQHSQAIGGTIDSIVPPLNSYHLQQPQFLPIHQPQYGQMNWNQKLINRENI